VPEGGGQISFSGWFTIVWNEQPHYFLAMAEFGTVELSIPEEVLEQAGGALSLDRKQVRLEGHWTGGGRDRIEVTSIQVEVE
jgi:hypothetical protein